MGGGPWVEARGWRPVGGSFVYLEEMIIWGREGGNKDIMSGGASCP